MSVFVGVSSDGAGVSVLTIYSKDPPAPKPTARSPFFCARPSFRPPTPCALPTRPFLLLPPVANHQQSTTISEAIQLLPLYSMALQKNVAFRGGTDVQTDNRAYMHSLLANMPVDHSRCFTYPRMFRCVRQ